MPKEKPHQFLILIGENIAKYRNKRKLSMEQLGLEVGLTRAHIHRIENGYNVTMITILKLSIALNVQPYKLLQVGYELNKEELEELITPKPKKIIPKKKKQFYELGLFCFQTFRFCCLFGSVRYARSHNDAYRLKDL